MSRGASALSPTGRTTPTAASPPALLPGAAEWKGQPPGPPAALLLALLSPPLLPPVRMPKASRRRRRMASSCPSSCACSLSALARFHGRFFRLQHRAMTYSSRLRLSAVHAQTDARRGALRVCWRPPQPGPCRKCTHPFSGTLSKKKATWRPSASNEVQSGCEVPAPPSRSICSPKPTYSIRRWLNSAYRWRGILL